MKRSLTDIEIREAMLVFGDSLTYPKIRVHEEVGFPNWIARIGAVLSRQPKPQNNAITVGNHIYFPVALHTGKEAINNLQLNDISWLMHELIHTWQFQHVGYRYLADAIVAQVRLGKNVYDFGGKKGLEDAHRTQKNFGSFNPEQQGDIVRYYYLGFKRGENVEAWAPFITEVKNTIAR
ncbi:MAG: hypothetical protein IIC78_13455 [Chloroflexi bacterium]|nr:hypothetical protein [Chloroflexota bacterium]